MSKMSEMNDKIIDCFTLPGILPADDSGQLSRRIGKKLGVRVDRAFVIKVQGCIEKVREDDTYPVTFPHVQRGRSSDKSRNRYQLVLREDDGVKWDRGTEAHIRKGAYGTAKSHKSQAKHQYSSIEAYADICPPAQKRHWRKYASLVLVLEDMADKAITLMNGTTGK